MKSDTEEFFKLGPGEPEHKITSIPAALQGIERE